jgi:hypothetical protein
VLGMCYILCTTSSVCIASGVQGGDRPPHGGLGAAPPRKKKKKNLPWETCHIFRWFFDTWFFADGFPFPVKKLGLLTNPGHWVRVLDVVGSYMYIVL